MNKNAIKGLIITVAGFILAYLFLENVRKGKKIKELKKEIDENENLTEEVKKQLTALIQNNAEIDPQIANELSQIAALLEIKQEPPAILKMAKIIENLMKELYKTDEKLKEVAKANNRKSPVFADYIEHCRNQNIISKEDYHLISLMKEIRNKEAHELGVKKEKARILAAFVSGMGLILGLCRLLNKKNG